MSERPHGTVAKRQIENCHCDPCMDAYRNWSRNRNRQIAYGRWQPYVDAEPARQHVRNLMEQGLGWPRISQLAGLSRGVVEALLYGHPAAGDGPSKNIRPDHAEKLLGVHADLTTLAPGRQITSVGMQRRIQALVCAGWPLVRLSTELGVDKKGFQEAVATGKVRVSTDAAVRDLYDRLWREDPRQHGVSNNSWSRAVNLAKDRGWAPVGAWDDDVIDDPDAYPDWTGQCGTPEGCNAHYRLKIPTCEPCREARSAHRREQRATAQEAAA